MSLQTVRALILKVNASGDHDAYLHLLSKTGLMDCFARGIRQAKPALRAQTEAFGYAEFVLFEHRGRYKLNQASFIYPFTKLKQSIEAQALAAYLAELTMDAHIEVPEACLELLLHCFYAFERALEEERPQQALMTVCNLAELALFAWMGHGLSFPEGEGLVYDRSRHLFLKPEIAQEEMEQWQALHELSSRTETVYQHQKRHERIIGTPLVPCSEALMTLLRRQVLATPGKRFSANLNVDLQTELANFVCLLRSAFLEKTYRSLRYFESLQKLTFRVKEQDLVEL